MICKNGSYHGQKIQRRNAAPFESSKSNKRTGDMVPAGSRMTVTSAPTTLFDVVAAQAAPTVPCSSA